MCTVIVDARVDDPRALADKEIDSLRLLNADVIFVTYALISFFHPSDEFSFLYF